MCAFTCPSGGRIITLPPPHPRDCCRSAEDCRNCGPVEPRVRDLVQGAYLYKFVDFNAARAKGALLWLACGG